MVGLSFVGSPATSLAPKLVASWALKEGVSAAVAGVAMHFITNFVLDKTTAAKLAPDAFKGPLGGELLAFGARSAANTVGYSSGGIDLGNTKTTMYSEQYTAADQQDFMKKSFFARMFDPTSSQSLIGHMAIAYSNNDSLSALTTNFLNVGHNLGNMFGAFLPKASAAPQFDWGFGQVGIPDTMMNDPDLQNPWDNASNVAGILDSSNGSATIARALSCFGDTITKSPTDGKWEVQHTQPVNKQSDDYINAHCNQISAEQDPSKDWRRVIMFVNDSTTVDSMACAENDQDACDRVAGKSPAAATTASASSSGGPNTTSGDWFAPSDTMTCPVGTDGGVQDGYHNGTLVKIRICDVQGIKVNARIANNTNNLLNDAKAAGINFLGGSGAFRTMQDQIAARTRNHCPDIYTAPASSCNPPTALPGYSNHQMGEAIDFDQDGKLLSSNMSGFAWLKANAAKYGLSNLPSENWHWSVDGN